MLAKHIVYIYILQIVCFRILGEILVDGTVRIIQLHCGA